MSSATDMRSIRLYNELQLVAVVILYYDHLITLSTEVSRIWSRPRAKASLWFFVHRGVPLIGHVAVLVYTLGDFTPSPKSCRAYTLFHQLLLVFNQTVVGVLLTLRTCAFYEKSRRILAALSLIIFGAIVLACRMSVTSQSTVLSGDQIYGCHSSLSPSSAKRIATPWEAQIVFDMTVFVLTIVRSYRHRQDTRLWFPRLNENRSNTMDLIDLIARDGAMYFGVMALANLANVLTFYFAPGPLRGGLSTFASCISITMMSRLILNLHDASLLLPSMITETTRSIAFATMRGTVMHPEIGQEDEDDIERNEQVHGEAHGIELSNFGPPRADDIVHE